MNQIKFNKNRLAFVEGWLSIIVNILLFVIKYWVGVVAGSVAIVADAWHSLSDSITSIVVIIGAKASGKPPDNKHPFGHGRAEIIASVIIGVLLAVVAFEFVIESIAKLKVSEKAQYGTIVYIVTILSIIMKEAMAQYAFWAGRKINSKSLKADGWHHRSDALSSIIVIIGISLGSHYWWIDGVMGIVISCLLFYGTYEILKDAVVTLLGKDAGEELILKVKKIAEQCYQRNLNLHHFHIHQYGNHQELTFHIKMNGQLTLGQAHGIATELEKKIEKELNIMATIHMEPHK